MANQEHLRKLLEGATAWNEWRLDNPNVVPDLRDQSFTWRNFKYYDLHDALLSDCNLAGADLRMGILMGADLRASSLHQTDMRLASARGADFRDCDMSGADMTDGGFTNCDFRDAVLTNAVTTGADFTGAVFEED